MGDTLTGCDVPAEIVPDFPRIYESGLWTLAKIGRFLTQKAVESTADEAEGFFEAVEELARVTINYDKLRAVVKFGRGTEEEQKSSEDPAVLGSKQSSPQDPTAVKESTTEPPKDPTPCTTPRAMSYAGAAKLPAPPPQLRSTKLVPAVQLKERSSAHPVSALACQACYCAGRKRDCKGGHCARCKTHNFACTYQRCPYDPECIKRECSLYHAGQLDKKELRKYSLLRLQFRKPGAACTEKTACEKV